MRQFLERVIDFVFLVGYNPLTPLLLLIFTLYDFACLYMEDVATAVMRERAGILRLVLIMCFCAAPLSPGLFVGWRSIVTLSSLFASVLLTATSIGFFVSFIICLGYTTIFLKFRLFILFVQNKRLTAICKVQYIYINNCINIYI